MTDSQVRERTSVRRQVTLKYNSLINSVDSLEAAELSSYEGILNNYLQKLEKLDSVILQALRLDESVSQDTLDSQFADCEDYTLKLQVLLNKIKLRLSGLGGTAGSLGGSIGGNKAKIKLPILHLPEFYADSKQDKFICKRFFELFEHLVKSYDLNEHEKFHLLEQQCHGRALVMISSIAVTQRTYSTAKQILIDAFAEEIPQKFEIIKEMSDLKFNWGKDDPYVFYAKIKKLIESIKDNGIDLDIILLYFIWSSLPTMFQDILVAITNKSYPSLNEVIGKFLEACSRYNSQIAHDTKPKNTSTANVFAASLNTKSSSEGKSCLFCNSRSHKMAQCSKYVTVDDKVNRLKELSKCLKCFKSGHFSKTCKFQTSGNCNKCKKGKHWSFMCRFQSKEPSKSPSETPSIPVKANLVSTDDDKGASGTSVVATSTQVDIVDSLLPFLTVTTIFEGSTVKIDTVLDSGSQNSFIDEALAKFLNLKVVDNHINLVIKGINSDKGITTRLVSLPFQIGKNMYNINCICIPEIKIELKTPNLNKLLTLFKGQGVTLAFDKFNVLENVSKVDTIKLLIGSKDWNCVMSLEGGVVGSEKLTSFYKIDSKLIPIGSVTDWIINLSNGKTFVTSLERVSELTETVSCLGTTEIELDSLVQFEDLDNIADIADYATLDRNCNIFVNYDNDCNIDETTKEAEREVTDFVLSNISQTDDGRFIMPIPWLSRYKDKLGSNEKLAFKVLESIKKKYKGSDVLNRINEVFDSQVKAGIIEKVQDLNNYKLKFPNYSFISHSPVIKEDRDTTKVRVIYMANLAEKNKDGTKGFNLNQCIHPGFNKNFKIADALVLMRFDKYIYGFDITKAFHQLAISEENSSRFLFWWFKDVSSGDFTPVVFRSKRVIFGMSVSPFLLQCSLFKLLILNSHPVEDEKVVDLKKRIYQGGYVDNFFVGCKSEAEISETFEKAKDIFNSSKFPLQQHVTNHCSFQKIMDKESLSSTPEMVKVLGMNWNRVTDCIIAKESKLNVEASSAREILSTIMGIYDLHNANLPLLNRCKIFLRKIQITYNGKWDDILSASELREWRNIAIQFNSGNMIEVPRFIGNRDSRFDIIVMCDASKDFIGCVLYMVEKESKRVSFVASHNKILNKNLQGRTMPVLELAAIEYGVDKGLNLYKFLTECLVPFTICDLFLFTDSTIALCWLNDSENLRNKSQKRSIYVNNRINNIIDKCKEVHSIKIGHIGTSENCADLTTRVVSYNKLRNSNFISGPNILKEDFSYMEWLIVPNPLVNNISGLPRLVVGTANVENECLEFPLDLSRFSSLNKAVRTLMKVKTFINNSMIKIDKLSSLDSSYQACKKDIIKSDQQKLFPDIFRFFSIKTPPKRTIPELVSKFNIFVDTDGLLRVRSKMGKLAKGVISKTPILLSDKGEFTRLLVYDNHRKYNHAGSYYLLHKLKSIYFIIKAYSTVKKVLTNCFHCKRFNSRPIQVNANDYKEWIINPIKQFFSVCFIDYFGPYVTNFGDQKVKTYGIIFKCVWSKMINIELVTSADTRSLLLAIQNHVYSYGLPKRMISDSGSNLASAFGWIEKCLNSPEIKEFCAEKDISVEFEQYPRGSLNRGIGGIIESGVAMAKKMIQGSIRNNVLDFLDFQHIIKQSICYMNKKPLNDKSALREQNVDNEFEVISPEYLKFGYETQVIECIFDEEQVDSYEEESMNKDLHKIIDIKQNLRHAYHQGYLLSMQDQATKYENKYFPKSHTKVEIGDIVLIKDPLIKSPNYPLARVVDKIHNSLGEVVQVKLYKANGHTVNRDISSVILLVRSNGVQDERSSNKVLDVGRAVGTRKAARECIERNKQLLDNDLV